jgi:3-oxoadipate CoA-transferase alpha subunit
VRTTNKSAITAHQWSDLMIDKSVSTLSEAIAGIHDGATIMIGGFGPAGQPTFLIDALIDQGARDLTIINNNAGNGEVGSRRC